MALPQTLNELRGYLKKAERTKRWGKMHASAIDKVKKLLNQELRILDWTDQAKSQFRDIQKVTGIPYEGGANDEEDASFVRGHPSSVRIEISDQARSAVLSPVTQEKEKNAGKRVLMPDDEDNEDNEVEEEGEDDEEREDGEESEDDESDDEPEYDCVCSVCDDGGYLLFCDGPCKRSFHPNHPRQVDGKGPNCLTLPFPNETPFEESKAEWRCKNCKDKLHQCYVCERLGDSDEAHGPEREVFGCDAASCGKFYHPWCIARKLKSDADERKALAKAIRAGRSYTCPLHRCKKCGRGEKKGIDRKLVKCRRCPVAWHVKCLPTSVRHWKLEKQFICYCTEHEILKELGTPQRNHIQFEEKSSEATKISKKLQKNVSVVRNERPGFTAELSSAVSQIPGKSAGMARAATQHTFKESAMRSPNAAKTSTDPDWKRLRGRIVDRSKKNMTKESELVFELALPKNYEQKEIDWMPQSRINSILNGARLATEKFSQSDFEGAELECPPEKVDDITREEENWRTYLAATFTDFETLRDQVMEELQPKSEAANHSQQNQPTRKSVNTAKPPKPPAKPTPLSDPSDHNRTDLPNRFLDPRAVSLPPRDMPIRSSRAQGPRSQRKKDEILLQASPSPSSHVPSQFHDSPDGRPPQVSRDLQGLGRHNPPGDRQRLPPTSGLPPRLNPGLPPHLNPGLPQPQDHICDATCYYPQNQLYYYVPPDSPPGTIMYDPPRMDCQTLHADECGGFLSD